MPTGPQVTITFPTENWKLNLQMAICGRRLTRLRVVGPITSSMLAHVIAVTITPPPKPPAAIPVPNALAASAAIFALHPQLMGLVMMGYSHFGFSGMAVSFDPKGAGSADNQLTFLLS